MVHIKVIRGNKYYYKSERQHGQVVTIYLGRADGFQKYSRAHRFPEKDVPERIEESQESGGKTLLERAKEWENKFKEKVNLHTTGGANAARPEEGVKEGVAGEPSGAIPSPTLKVNLQIANVNLHDVEATGP